MPLIWDDDFFVIVDCYKKIFMIGQRWKKYKKVYGAIVTDLEILFNGSLIKRIENRALLVGGSLISTFVKQTKQRTGDVIFRDI